MKDIGFRRTRFLGLILLSFTMITFLGACKGKTVEEAKPIAAEKVVSLDTLKPIFGEAKEDMPGVQDVAKGEGEVIIAYRYYDADAQNIDNDMVAELAPKIQALYKNFKTLDRVAFQVTVNGAAPGEWKPYSRFVLTRKIVDEIQWSGILAEDFLKSVLEHQRY
jgi:hypothetical protein